MTRNVKWHKLSNDTKCQLTQSGKLNDMTHGTWQITNNKWHMTHDAWHMKQNVRLHITHMTQDT